MYRKTFEQLSNNELYALIKLRQDVFIIEQNSIYMDIDNLDQMAIHYFDLDESNKLMAYARYRYAEIDNEVKIERVVLAKRVRGKGLGKRLIETMLNDIIYHYPQTTVSLSSQCKACQFYRSMGFVVKGQPYDDGGIAHVKMLYQP